MIAGPSPGRFAERPTDEGPRRASHSGDVSDGSRDFSPYRHGDSLAAPPVRAAQAGAFGVPARTDPRQGQRLPARTALHARPRPEVARQARPTADLTALRAPHLVVAACLW